MKSIVTACLLAGTLTAHADEISGFHLGVGAGQTTASVDSGFEAESTTYKGFIGYRFNRSLAIEAAYVDVEELSDFIYPYLISEKVNGISASLLGSLPMGSNAAVFVRAGALNWSADQILVRTQPYRVSSSSVTGTDFVWGAGIQANAGRFGFRAEYERSEVDFVKYELLSGGLFFMF